MLLGLKSPRHEMRTISGNARQRRGGQHGLILINVLMILSLLVGIAFGARVMMQTDYKIVANLRGGTEAFYLAESGIAWSMEALARAVGHPPVLTAFTQGLAPGSFSVSFSSSTVPSHLSAKTVVRSIGSVGVSTQTLQAQLTKSYDLADSAVGLRGNAGRVNFASDSFAVSGLDHDPVSGTPIMESKARPAISVSGEALEALVVQALADSQRSESLISANGTPVIAPSDYLPGSMIDNLAKDLCEMASALTGAIPADGVLTVRGENWGTPLAPQVRCFSGLPGPGDAVNLAGPITGAGILVIKDATLTLSGDFRWDGMILVTGDNVGFNVTGAADKAILGALIVHETGVPGGTTALFDLQGTIRILFSRAALSKTEALFPPSVLENVRAMLPFTVRQDYWRIVASN